MATQQFLFIQNLMAHLIQIRQAGLHMNIMWLFIEATMAAFQHGRHRGRQIAVHALGKAFLDGIQICCYQNSCAAFREQCQVFRLRNDIDQN